MPFLQNTSLQRKQTVLMMLTCTAALLLACVSFVSYEALRFKGELQRDLETLADVFGNNSVAALEFEDRDVGREILGAVRAIPSVAEARVYNAAGKEFARYER